jgi:hypothetical protein
LPPVQADQLSLERDTMLPMMDILGLLRATIGSETGDVGDAVTGSDVGVGDAISERMGRRTWKGLEFV